MTRMLRPQTAIYMSHEAGPDEVIFHDLMVERDYREAQSFRWPTDVRQLPGAPARVDASLLLRKVEADGSTDAVLDWEDAVVSIHLYHGSVSGKIIAADRESITLALSRAADLFPRSAAAEDEVPITFWSYSQHGPRAVGRRITVPTWAQIESNYAGDAREHLERMMHGFRPSHGGQLVLWQGVPGTGKTWALRALASEWRDWADIHYIVDPEVFFGERSDYMLDVLLHGAEDEPDEDTPARWRVLLLEDTGEILAADAKQKTGQSLSRLLNVVDGLIGQGLRILVLVTTNEELKKLHPAVARPGRCAARITFGELSADEAREWATARDTAVPHERATLAELYAAVEGYDQAEQELVGFAP